MRLLGDSPNPWKRAPDSNPVQKALPLFSQNDFDAGLEHLGWPVGLKSTYPSEYRRRIAAAAISYVMQLNSVDYTKKRYLQDVKYAEDGDTRLDNRVSQCIGELASAIHRHVVALGHLGDENVGTFMAQVTFIRAKASIAAMLTSANRGLLFESIAVARMLIEQVGWATAAVGVDDVEAVQRISATKSIRKLKLAYDSAGDFYGWLSDYAHWAYHAHVNVIDWSGEKIQTILASCLFKARALTVSLVTADCMNFAFQAAFPEIREADDLRSHSEATRKLAKELGELVPDDEAAAAVLRFLNPANKAS